MTPTRVLRAAIGVSLMHGIALALKRMLEPISCCQCVFSRLYDVALVSQQLLQPFHDDSACFENFYRRTAHARRCQCSTADTRADLMMQRVLQGLLSSVHCVALAHSNQLASRRDAHHPGVISVLAMS